MKFTAEDNTIPLLIADGALYSFEKNGIYRSRGGSKSLVFNLKGRGVLPSVIGRFPLLRRFLREGVHHLSILKGNYIVFLNGKIITYGENGDILNIFTTFSGSRPLNVLAEDGKVTFGEYFKNPKRDPVRVFQTEDGLVWKVKFTFRSKSIRHIHNIQKHKECLYVLSGDDDHESGIWKCDKSFSSVIPLKKGSQSDRAVSVLFSKDGDIIVPSDTPLEKNYIRKLDKSDLTYQELYCIAGSCFHACSINGVLFVATVVEPSKVNKSNHATIYGSLDGERWVEIFRLKKDLIPRGLQKYFRYAELKLLPEPWEGSIVVHGRALRKCSDGLIKLNLREVCDLLAG